MLLCIFRRLFSLNNKHANNITWLQNQIKKRIIWYSPTRVLYTPGFFYEICVARILIFYVVFCSVLYFFFGLFPLLISLSVLFRLAASDYTTFVFLKLSLHNRDNDTQYFVVEKHNYISKHWSLHGTKWRYISILCVIVGKSA